MSEGRTWEVADEASARGGPLVHLEDLGRLEPVIKHILGSGVYVHETDYYPDGRAVAYLGNALPTDTSPAPDQPELSFLNYAPIGAALVAPADGDGESEGAGEVLAVHLPDRDDLHRAGQARRRHENEHRAEVVPAMVNFLDDRRTMHHDQAGEYGLHDVDSLAELDLDPMEMFHLGREVGMQKMAAAAHRRFTGRLDAAYDGGRRWTSPEYEVIRKRRSVPITDWPTPLGPEADP